MTAQIDHSKILARRARGCGTALASVIATALAIAVTGGAAMAQSYIVIGNNTQDVVVDQSVIDDLGPPPSISGTLRPGTYGPGMRGGYAPQAPLGLAPGEKPRSRLLAIPQLPDAAPPPAPVPRRVAAPPPQAAPAPAPRPPQRQAANPPPSVPAPRPAPPVAAAPPPPPAAPPVPAPAPAPLVAAAPPPPPPPPPSTPATPPPQVAAPNPADTAGGAQQASLPKQPVGGVGQLTFDGNSAALSDGARGSLDKLAEQLKVGDQRLQVVAYAAAQGQNASQARRLSLSRALAVRSYLIDKGIRSTRIDVRAMGATESGGAPDRVDLVLVSQ